MLAEIVREVGSLRGMAGLHNSELVWWYQKKRKDGSPAGRCEAGDGGLYVGPGWLLGKLWSVWPMLQSPPPMPFWSRPRMEANPARPSDECTTSSGR
jgi:hypothetical protein